VSGTSLESAVRICDGTASVVVEMRFDVARNNSAKSADKVVDLPWSCATDGIGNADPVHADFVDCAVHGKKVDEVRAERIFGRKADFKALGLDKLDYLNCSLLHVSNCGE